MLAVEWACGLSGGWPSTSCILKTRNYKFWILIFISSSQDRDAISLFPTNAKCNQHIWIIGFGALYNFLYIHFLFFVFIAKNKIHRELQVPPMMWVTLMISSYKKWMKELPKETKLLCTLSVPSRSLYCRRAEGSCTQSFGGCNISTTWVSGNPLGRHCHQGRSNTQGPGMGHSDNSEEFHKEFTTQISWNNSLHCVFCISQGLKISYNTKGPGNFLHFCSLFGV